MFHPCMRYCWVLKDQGTRRKWNTFNSRRYEIHLSAPWGSCWSSLGQNCGGRLTAEEDTWESSQQGKEGCQGSKGVCVMAWHIFNAKFVCERVMRRSVRESVWDFLALSQPGKQPCHMGTLYLFIMFKNWD